MQRGSLNLLKVFKKESLRTFIRMTSSTKESHLNCQGTKPLNIHIVSLYAKYCLLIKFRQNLISEDITNQKVFIIIVFAVTVVV